MKGSLNCIVGSGVPFLLWAEGRWRNCGLLSPPGSETFSELVMAGCWRAFQAVLDKPSMILSCIYLFNLELFWNRLGQGRGRLVGVENCTASGALCFQKHALDFHSSFRENVPSPLSLQKAPILLFFGAQLCLTLFNPMDCNTPGFPVLHHIPEFAETHVH